MGWTTQELSVFLRKRNVPESAYSFGGDKDDAYCIRRVGAEWLVYYSERGHANELAWGKTEAQALDVLKLYLLEAHRLL